MSNRGSSSSDSHSETMVKKMVRAEVGLLRDDWFLPVLATALDKALTYIGAGYNLHWREAANRAIEETYVLFDIKGLRNLAGNPLESLEAGEEAA